MVRTALASALLVAAVLSGGSPAQAAGTSRADATPISAAPFTSSEFPDLTPQPPSSGPDNVAVANACNGGQPIYLSRWWQYTPTTTTTVVARSHVLHKIGRTSIDHSSGVALVSEDGAVLDCATETGVVGTAPASVEHGASLFIVQFLPQDTSCAPDAVVCYETSRFFALKPTTGEAPANDDWQSATPISTLPYSQTVDTTMATEQQPDRSGSVDGTTWGYPDCLGGTLFLGAARTAWWSYTPAVTGQVVLTLNGSPALRDRHAWGAPRAVIGRLTAAGPDFRDYCEGDEIPTLQAGVTYLFHVGNPITNYYYRDYVDAGGEMTLSVAVAKPPTAPTGLIATHDYDARSATVTWAPPVADDGPPVTGYRVARDGTDSGGAGPWSKDLPATARTQTFTLLNPGATYTLSVQAINAVATGPAASVQVTMAPPTSAAGGGAAPVVAPPAVVPPAVVPPAPVAVITPPPAVVQPPATVLRPALIRTIRITRVQYNAPGADSRRNLNGEYVRLKNTGTRAVTLTGWTIRDAAGSRYTFRTTRLAAGATLTVFSGKGTATATKKYWSRTSHVWNNSGRESARVRDSYGRTVDSCAWTSGRAGYATC